TASFELGGPALTSRETGKRVAQIVLGLGPGERHAFAGLFLQRLAIGSNRLVELRRPTLAPPEIEERNAKIVLCQSPLERRRLTGPLLQHLAVGGDGLFQ